MIHHCARAFYLMLTVSFIFSTCQGLKMGAKLKQIFEADFKSLVVVEFHSLPCFPWERNEKKTSQQIDKS